VRYKGEAQTCHACPLRAQCTTSHKGRSLRRSEHEDMIVAHRAWMETTEAKRVYRLRGQTIEIVFADFKEHRGLRRFSSRGLVRVRTELAFGGAGAQSARGASFLKPEAKREGDTSHKRTNSSIKPDDLSMPWMAAGRCSGAYRTSCRKLSRSCRFTRSGALWSAPPWTRRWPTASGEGSLSFSKAAKALCTAAC